MLQPLVLKKVFCFDRVGATAVYQHQRLLVLVVLCLRLNITRSKIQPGVSCDNTASAFIPPDLRLESYPPPLGNSREKKVSKTKERGSPERGIGGASEVLVELHTISLDNTALCRFLGRYA